MAYGLKASTCDPLKYKAIVIFKPFPSHFKSCVIENK